MYQEPMMTDAQAGFLVLFFLASLIAYLFFLGSLHGALKTVNEDRRAMQPGMVWINLIPFVNLVWLFFTVVYIGRSLYAEAVSLGMSERGDGLKSIGLAYAILTVGSVIPWIGMFIAIPLLVVWIVYWVKVVGYKNRLKSLQSSGRVSGAVTT